MNILGRLRSALAKGSSALSPRPARLNPSEEPETSTADAWSRRWLTWWAALPSGQAENPTRVPDDATSGVSGSSLNYPLCLAERLANQWCPPDFTDEQRARLVSVAEDAAARGVRVQDALVVAIACMFIGIDPMGVA